MNTCQSGNPFRQERISAFPDSLKNHRFFNELKWTAAEGRLSVCRGIDHSSVVNLKALRSYFGFSAEIQDSSSLL